MSHSRLLRFLLPLNNTNKMAEPTQIFDYQNPENVEAEVPGAQKIREPTNAENTSMGAENTSMDAENVSTHAENAKVNQNMREVTSSFTEVMEDGKVVHRELIASERNGDGMEDKQEDKRSKTKIPVSRFRQTVERVKAERRGSKDQKEHESQIPVRRSSIPKPSREHKPSKTVKKELTITKTETKIESSQPDDEFDKIYAEIVVNTPTEVNFDDSILNPKVEDSEKLESTFEEIIHDYDEHKVEPIDVEVVRRSQIPFLKRKSQQDIELGAQAERTSKIIAARDKLRLRHSLNKNEDFEKELDKELNKAEPSRPNNTPELSESGNSKSNPMTDTKTEKEFKHEVISSPNSRVDIKKEITKTTSTSNDTENTQSSSVVETVTVKEVTTNESVDRKENKQLLIEENIAKNSILIGIPVLDSHIHEVSETRETSKVIEMRKVLSYTSTTEDLSMNNDISPRNDKRPTKSEIFETHLARELDVSFTENDKNLERTKLEKLKIKPNEDINNAHLSEAIDVVTTNNFGNNEVEVRVKKGRKHETTEKTKDKEELSNEEDIIQLRGKVERIISKIDSKEIIETDINKRESINELTKKKTVLSKIALFERSESESPEKTKIPLKICRLPKLITKDLKVEHNHIHTPLIVDEVFKPFQRDNDFKIEENNVNNPVKNVELTTFEKAERVTVTTPNSAHYAVDNKTQIESPYAVEKITLHSTTEHQGKEEQMSSQSDIKSDYTVEKAEFATITEVLPTIDINDTKIKKIHEEQPKHEARTSQIDNSVEKHSKDYKTNYNVKEIPKLDTKEDEPKTPGYKTVSELLRSFETKTPKRSFTRRHVSREFSIKDIDIQSAEVENKVNIEYSKTEDAEIHNFESINEYKSLDDVFTSDFDTKKLKLKVEDEMKRAKSLAELDLGDAVKGKVNSLITRMVSVDRTERNRRESIINMKEMPRKRSVSEKIALFEGKLTPSRGASPAPLRVYRSEKIAEVPRMDKKIEELKKGYNVNRFEIQKENSTDSVVEKNELVQDDEERIKKAIEELRSAKKKYGKIEKMPVVELSNGMVMPALAVGTALLDPRLIYHVVSAAIDLGYRAVDCAYIYGNEKEVGEAVRAKIEDGTVKREDLFIISKLWSTYHRTDLVEGACRASLDAMGLDYFDMYLIHNPMSFKEGAGPIPRIATVLQYSEHDYLDAWYGMETLVTKGLARAIGVSNFNSVQLQRVMEKGRVKPVVNQVECHPYLSQQRLDNFCSSVRVALSCYGVLGSKGTPLEYKSGAVAAIDDPLVQVMASGLNMTAAQLLIRYQLENNRNVVVKASSAAHLWDNLRAVDMRLSTVEVDALNALNRNRRTFTFRGMGDTHKNYPFNIAF